MCNPGKTYRHRTRKSGEGHVAQFIGPDTYSSVLCVERYSRRLWKGGGEDAHKVLRAGPQPQDIDVSAGRLSILTHRVPGFPRESLFVFISFSVLTTRGNSVLLPRPSGTVPGE